MSIFLVHESREDAKAMRVVALELLSRGLITREDSVLPAILLELEA
jgi:hypothetical protein